MEGWRQMEENNGVFRERIGGFGGKIWCFWGVLQRLCSFYGIFRGDLSGDLSEGLIGNLSGGTFYDFIWSVWVAGDDLW